MFRPGKIYKRKSLHKKYGGQSASGISTPSKHPFIFLFTGASGKEFGYEDGWDNAGIFHYTGEGQVGNMQFIKGNLAIRDHRKNGKELHLFEQLKDGKVKYLTQMECVDYENRKGKDRVGNDREIIVFSLAPNGAVKQTVFDRAIYKEGNEQTVTQTKKERNPLLRRDAIAKYGMTCMVCGFNFDKVYGKDIAKGYIEVHHEKMLSEIKGEREVSVEDVKVVCSNCHRIMHRTKVMLDWRVLKENFKKR